MAKRMCSVEGCDRPVKGHGWCEGHYCRWKAGGDVRADVPLRKRRPPGSPPAKCSVEDCYQPAFCRGWCTTHYARWERNGDLELRRFLYAPDAVCSVDGCDEPAYARGWCLKHYQRWSKRPDRSDPSVSLRPEMEMTEEERFWAKVNKDGPVPAWRPELGPCWIWTAGGDSHGYGHFRSIYGLGAHRWSYSREIGPIPDDRPHLDHLCRVPPCVNPAHLEPVTFEENLRRGAEARRALRGGKCVNGHEMTPENTYVWPDGKRISCRQCVRDSQRRYQERRKSNTQLF